MKHILIAFLLMGFTSQAYTQIYKWRDKNGELHFSDKKPADSGGVKTVKPDISKMSSGESQHTSSLVERANRLPERHAYAPKRIKKKSKKSKNAYDPGFRHKTGFDNKSQLKKAKKRCKKNRFSDCSTNRLITKRKNSEWQMSPKAQNRNFRRNVKYNNMP